MLAVLPMHMQAQALKLGPEQPGEAFWRSLRVWRGQAMLLTRSPRHLQSRKPPRGRHVRQHMAASRNTRRDDCRGPGLQSCVTDCMASEPCMVSSNITLPTRFLPATRQLQIDPVHACLSHKGLQAYTGWQQALSDHQMHGIHLKGQQTMMWRQHKLQLAQIDHRCSGHASSLPLLLYTLLLEHCLEALFSLPRLPLHTPSLNESA